MAEETEGSTEIDASPQQVMDVITDFGRYPEWAQGVKNATVLKMDSKGRPSEVSMEVRMLGINAAYTLKYTYRAKHAGLSWKSTEASGAVKDIKGEYVLEASGDRTLVTYRTTMEPAMNLGSFMRRQAERMIINAALGGLKKRVEQG